MKYRTLGKTNLQISEIGYGTWQFANDSEMWVGATREESERSLLTAIDSGVNFIDTARSYGDGLSEQWIGEIIKKRPNANLIIASKMYPMNWEWPAIKGVPMSEVFPKKHIIQLVDESLKTLDREYLDIMQFHVWQDDWVDENDEWKETIQDITKQGKVKFWGISTNNYEPTNCIEACKTGLISVVQTIFNLYHQSPSTEFFPFAKENAVGVIARVPLDEGGLTGNLHVDTQFEEGDFRKNYFTPERLTELEKRNSALMQFVTGDIRTLPELALRYILTFDEVSTVIPGMRKLTHVQENIALTDKPKLSAQIMEQLKNHAWERNFYS